MYPQIITSRNIITRRKFVAGGYINDMKSLFGAALYAYYPLDDAVGSSSARDATGNGHTGTATGCTFGADGPSGHTVCQFNGTSDFIQLPHATLDTPFDETQGALMAFIKMTNAGVWTDGVYRVSCQIGTDANNRIYHRKINTNDTMQGSFTAGGTPRLFQKGSYSNVGWFHVCVKWGGGTAEYFIDGVDYGSGGAAMGSWSGALTAAYSRIGVNETTLRHSGWISDVILLNTKPSDAQVLQAATQLTP